MCKPRARLAPVLMVCLSSVLRLSRCFTIRTEGNCPSTRIIRDRDNKKVNNPRRFFSALDDLLGEVERLLANEDDKLSSQQDENSAFDDKSQTKNVWRKPVDWENVPLRQTKPSIVEEYMIKGRRVYIKRDDLLRLPGAMISGNKARKMLVLNELKDFPACIVSYGGPQSNSMLALAAICNYKSRGETISTKSDVQESLSAFEIVSAEPMENHQKHRFVYYLKKLPRFLRKQPSGNFFRAISLGMEVRELSPQEYKDLFGGDWGGRPNPPVGLSPSIPHDSMWVPQGGASAMALAGVQVLAQEIVSYWSQNGNDRPLSICVPGGTCATAVLLHHQIQKFAGNQDIQVVVIPCLGDVTYARRQMMSLSVQVGAAADNIPAILHPIPEDNLSNSNNPNRESKYFNFGEPDRQILDTFRLMKDDYDLMLDLIYGAPAWTIMLRHWFVEGSLDSQFDPYRPIAGREVMYVHSGGLEGINSQLLRYKHKGLVEIDQIQLPGK